MKGYLIGIAFFYLFGRPGGLSLQSFARDRQKDFRSTPGANKVIRKSNYRNKKPLNESL